MSLPDKVPQVAAATNYDGSVADGYSGTPTKAPPEVDFSTRQQYGFRPGQAPPAQVWNRLQSDNARAYSTLAALAVTNWSESACNDTRAITYSPGAGLWVRAKPDGSSADVAVQWSRNRIAWHNSVGLSTVLKDPRALAAYASTVVVAGYTSTGSTSVCTSYDGGKTWTFAMAIAGTYQADMCYDPANAKWIMVAAHETSGPVYTPRAYSDTFGVGADGATFAIGTLPGVLTHANPTTCRLATNGLGRTVLCSFGPPGAAKGQAWYSTDAVTWTQSVGLSSLLDTDEQLRGVCYSAAQSAWFMATQGGNILRSVDGVTWADVAALGVRGAPTGIVAVGAALVCVGLDTTNTNYGAPVWVSTDGGYTWLETGGLTGDVATDVREAGGIAWAFASLNLGMGLDLRGG